VPPLVTQIADGENGGVMMNEFPRQVLEVGARSTGSRSPMMNVSEYLDHLYASGHQGKPICRHSSRIHQKRIWERFKAGRWAKRNSPKSSSN
jgi:hypothetical protein